MKNLFLIIVSLIWLQACAQSKTEVNTADSEQQFEIEKTDKEWKATLTDEEYRVLRQQGTERAFSGELLNNKKEGVYTCAGCGNPLFSSETKFKSGTGWPSFFEPLDKDAILEIVDNSYGMKRIETVCQQCGGHLGHVFDDGPAPTGLRYCMNSVALKFQEKRLKE